MTDTQKSEIITLYNEHRDNAETCIERMDKALDDEKAARTAKAQKRQMIAGGSRQEIMTPT